MKRLAIYCLKCKDVVYSRSRHDFRFCSCKECAIDGGEDYTKTSGNCEIFELEIDATQEDLEYDYSKRRKRPKYGLIKGSGSSSHFWGDGFPFFDDVAEAADYIGTFLRRWGRVRVYQTKEKYGTARCYLSFGFNELHCILYPGYAYCQYSKWFGIYWFKHLFSYTWEVKPENCNWFIRMLNKMAEAVWWFDIYIMGKLVRPLNKIVIPYHIWLYKRAYRKAIEKWPYIREEILDGADCHEFLKGL